MQCNASMQHGRKIELRLFPPCEVMACMRSRAHEPWLFFSFPDVPFLQLLLGVNGALRHLQAKAREPGGNYSDPPLYVSKAGRMALHSVRVSCCLALYSLARLPLSFLFPIHGCRCLPVHIHRPCGRALVLVHAMHACREGVVMAL